MSRLKKPIDYVNTLRLNPKREKRELGETLHGQYQQWTRSLLLKDLLSLARARYKPSKKAKTRSEQPNSSGSFVPTP